MYQVAEDVKGLETVLDMKKDRTAEDIVSRSSENVEGMKLAKDTVQLNLAEYSIP